MDSRCAVSPCLVDIAYRLKHFIFDLNSLFGFFKDIGRFCNNEADRISDHPGGIALGDHDIPVLSDMTHFIAGDILRRQHAQYARKRLGFGLMDLLDDRSRIVRAHSGSIGHGRHVGFDDRTHLAAVLAIFMNIGSWMQLTVLTGFLDCLFAPSGQFDDPLGMIFRNEIFRPYIVRVFSVAQNFSSDIDSENILSDAVSGHMTRIVIMGDTRDNGRIILCAVLGDVLIMPLFFLMGKLGDELDLFISAQDRSGSDDSGNDLLIAGTAAEIAPDRFFDLSCGRIGVLIDEGFSGQYHARDTEAALDRPA